MQARAGLLWLLAVALTGVAAVAGPAAAQTSGLDPSFGSNGIVVMRPPQAPDAFRGPHAVLTVAGNTYVAGSRWTGTYNSVGDKLYVTVVGALDSAGRAVSTFGKNGWLSLGIVGWDAVPDRLLHDRHGGLLLMERRTASLGGAGPHRVYRIELATGSLDTSWGRNGSVRADGPAGFDVDSQGRIYLYGEQGLRRLTPQGQLDSTWVLEGMPEYHSARTLAVDSENRLLLVPDFRPPQIWRISATGARDLAFGGGDGIVELPSHAADVAPVPGGDFVVGEGVAVSGASTAQLERRASADGALVAAWGDGGRVTLPWESCSGARSLNIDPAGGIVGLADDCDGQELAFRVDADGLVDDQFTVDPSLDPLRPVKVSGIAVGGDGLLTAFGRPPGQNGDPGAVARLSPDLAQTAGTGFVPLPPTRVLDTRSGLGAPKARLDQSQTLRLQVAGVGGVPADAAAVVLNVTAVAATADSYITVWPAGGARPTVSNLNVRPGVTRPNAVTVKVGKSGSVDIFNRAGSLDVVVDVAGYYSATAGVGFTPLTAPQRILDTRNGTGAPATQATAVAPVRLHVAGRAGVPSSATAVVMNVTAVKPTIATHVTVWPGGTTRPTASSLNVKAGEVAPNLVTVKIGGDGTVVLAPGGGSVHLVADVAGWYGATGETLFVPLEPTRLLDTRNDGLAVQGNETLEAFVEMGGVPPFAAAVSLNLTAVRPTAAGYVIAYPAGRARPLASNLNLTPEQTVPNLAIVGVGDGGSIDLYNRSGTTHLLADVAGYFTH